jgi:tetratricopeptide (TPR) repeat protein
MGRFDDSLKHLRLAIQLDPDNAGFILNLGTTLLRKGSLENAETCFETASNLNPTNSMPYANLAAVAMTRGQFDKASDLLARAIQLDSWFPGFYLQQGEILHAQGNEEEARKAYLSLIRLEGSPALLSDVSLTLRELGAEVEAMLALRKSLSLDPRNTRSQLRLARLLSSSPVDSVRNGQEAMHLMESVLRTQPIRTPELLDLYSTCLAESGRYAEATTMAKEALSLSRNAKEEWVAALEKRIALFENGKPFRERPKGSLIPKVAPPGLARS